MWFSNLIAYHFKQPVDYNQADFEAALEQDVSRTPGQQEMRTMGWTKALGKHGETLAHFSHSRILLCCKTIEKAIPSAVVNEQLAEKVDIIEREENRPVKKKEKDELKEAILFKMLETAYTKSSVVYAFIDIEKKLLVVNAGSFNKAEELLALLRKSLGTLPVVPLFSHIDLDVYLTSWLTDYKSPNGFAIGGDANLEEPDDKAAQTKFKGQELSSDEVQAHLFGGSCVTRLQLKYQDHLTFDLLNDGQIKRINYSATLKEENANIPSEEMAKKLDADFFLASGEIIEMINQLFIHGFEDLIFASDNDLKAMSENKEAGDDKSEQLKQQLVDNLHISASEDPLYNDAVEYVKESRHASVSSLQRKLRTGYNRSARLMEQMEKDGIVSEPQHNGGREVLV
ncbi:MAG: recombination associated protein RdgC [Pseudoalteromonas distincta]|jgi:recombination associated protein RdgC